MIRLPIGVFFNSALVLVIMYLLIEMNYYWFVIGLDFCMWGMILTKVQREVDSRLNTEEANK